MSKSKKITILYVLKILQECSSKSNPISQALIARTITLAGFACDRKVISRDIEILIQFGYDIKKVKGVGCFINSNM